VLVALAMATAPGCDKTDTPFHPEPPGLEDPPLDRTMFMNQVLPVLNNLCVGCHGTGNHPFPLTGGADPELDYYRAADQVEIDDPPASLLLLKPLHPDAGGVVHNAPAIFLSQSDPDFQILAAWASGEVDSGARRPTFSEVTIR
jgi:hypothetical protein